MRPSGKLLLALFPVALLLLPLLVAPSANVVEPTVKSCPQKKRQEKINQVLHFRGVIYGFSSGVGQQNSHIGDVHRLVLSDPPETRGTRLAHALGPYVVLPVVAQRF
jgi:hypothetical protein